MNAESLSKAIDNMTIKVQLLSSHSSADFIDSDYVVELFFGMGINTY